MRRTEEAKRRPEAIWKEHDCLNGKKVRAMVAILRTRGCWWSDKEGCTMCGYHFASMKGIGLPELREQLERVLEKYEGEEMVKIYTSGSFLDTREIPLELREELFTSFDRSQRILVESRPEFVTQKNLDGIDVDRLEMAIGLESAQDDVREHCVRKGFTFDDYLRASRSLDRLGVPLRTYLLLKPPFLTEAEAIEDTVRSVQLVREISESISINPVNVQRDTLVDWLWRRGDYRPPWWWSLIQVLEKTFVEDGPRIFSAPSGAGTPRGIHNCGKCDKKVIEAIAAFSFSQDLEDLKGLECDCREEWRAIMTVQDAMNTSVDIGRHVGSVEEE
jgi:archaeosine synthase beta-subunit